MDRPIRTCRLGACLNEAVTQHGFCAEHHLADEPFASGLLSEHDCALDTALPFERVPTLEAHSRKHRKQARERGILKDEGLRFGPFTVTKPGAETKEAFERGKDVP